MELGAVSLQPAVKDTSSSVTVSAGLLQGRGPTCSLSSRTHGSLTHPANNVLTAVFGGQLHGEQRGSPQEARLTVSTHGVARRRDASAKPEGVGLTRDFTHSSTLVHSHVCHSRRGLRW